MPLPIKITLNPNGIRDKHWFTGFRPGGKIKLVLKKKKED